MQDGSGRGGGGIVVVPICEKLLQLVVGNTLCIRKMNEPVVIIQAKLFTSQSCACLNRFTIRYRIKYVKTILYFWLCL